MEFSHGDSSRAGLSLAHQVADPSDGDVFERGDIEIMRAMLEAARHKSRSPAA